MSENTTTPPASSPAPAAAPVVTPEHISALHRHLDEIGHAMAVGFKAVIEFVRKQAPAVEAGAAAVAAAVPVVGPVAGVVAQVAGEAAAIASCCAHDQSQHFANGKCAQPGCSCKAG